MHMDALQKKGNVLTITLTCSKKKTRFKLSHLKISVVTLILASCYFHTLITRSQVLRIGLHTKLQNSGKKKVINIFLFESSGDDAVIRRLFKKVLLLSRAGLLSIEISPNYTSPIYFFETEGKSRQ